MKSLYLTVLGKVPDILRTWKMLAIDIIIRNIDGATLMHLLFQTLRNKEKR